MELGFIGSVKSGFYADRRNFSLKLATVEPLQIMRTKPGRDYVKTLNEVRFFISAHVKFGEYMIKNGEISLSSNPYRLAAIIAQTFLGSTFVSAFRADPISLILPAIHLGFTPR